MTILIQVFPGKRLKIRTTQSEQNDCVRSFSVYLQVRLKANEQLHLEFAVLVKWFIEEINIRVRQS